MIKYHISKTSWFCNHTLLESWNTVQKTVAYTCIQFRTKLKAWNYCGFAKSKGWRKGRPIELLHIECVLLYPVSQKSVSTKWRIYKGKINSPQDFCYKNNVRNIQNGGFIRAKLTSPRIFVIKTMYATSKMADL